MKRIFLPLFFSLLPLLFLCGCQKEDNVRYLSEVRSDIFLAETQAFSLTITCVEREYPYADDGIAGEKSKLMEVTLSDKQGKTAYDVYYEFDGVKQGGETSFRNVTDDFYFSCGTDSFPQSTLLVKVEWEDGYEELAATSVKNEKTISPEKALDCAIRAEREYVSSLTRDGVFHGEYRVRLLRRECNYYYVGIVTKDGTKALLLDAETGEVLAKHDS